MAEMDPHYGQLQGVEQSADDQGGYQDLAHFLLPLLLLGAGMKSHDVQFEEAGLFDQRRLQCCTEISKLKFMIAKVESKT